MKAEKTFVCEKLPTYNCHATTLLPLKDGSVVFAWFGGTKEGRNDVDIWYCRKDENGFSAPKKMSENLSVPHWNPVLFQHTDGSIRLFFKVGKVIKNWRTFYCISTDGGRTFSKPEELVKGDRYGGRGPVKNKCLRLSDGRILAPASTENAGWNCYIDISDDDGKTWRKTQKIKTEYISPVLNIYNGHCSSKIPMIQPTLWESKPGTVHMLTRTAVGRIYRSDSTDNGETWSEAYPTVLPNNNSGIDVTKTPDGKLYLVMNPVEDNWGERSPLVLQVSEDNGSTWKVLLTLEEEKKDSEFSYPAIVFLDGSLHVSYTWERKNVAYWKIDL